MPNPSGRCRCGCGKRTNLAKQTSTKRGHVAGQPVDYIIGHSSRRYERTWDPAAELPLCACGCGNRVTLSKTTTPARGLLVGEPNRFVRGHWNRPELRCIEEDRGYETLCCIWQGQIDKLGYPRRDRTDMRTVLVHRQVYIEAHGDIPNGIDAHHLCGQKDCVRLEHLELRSRSDHARRHRGVTTEKRDAILEALRIAEESQAALARRFGVTNSYIWRLKKSL